VRPKLRSDVRYVPSDDGVHVFSAASSFGLAGASVEPLLDRLVGYLDGEHSVESIVDGLPERHQQVVTKLIDTLMERQVVYDAAAEQAHQLQDWELAKYHQEIAFAELAAGSGAHRFERFRLAKVLMVGAGGAFDALLSTMLQLGSCGGTILVTGDNPDARERRRELLAAGQREDPLLQLPEVADPGQWDSVADVTSLLASYQAVLHCDDRAMLGRAAVLTRAARAAGVPALHAIVAGGHAWVGPTDFSDRLGCWECAWRYRIGALTDLERGEVDHQFLDDAASLPADQLTAPISGVVGAMLAMAHFRLVTHEGGRELPAGRLVQIDLETAIAQQHPFHRHPACRACSGPTSPDRAAFTRRLEELRTGPVRTDDDLSRAATELYGPELGAILSFDEGDYLQLPLVITSAVVNDLTCAGAGPYTLTVAAADQPRARRRAAVRAIETLASLAARADFAAEPGWAWDVSADAVVPLPPAGERARCAVAAGNRWAEAVGRGLLRQCRQLTLEHGSTSRPLTELPDVARELVDAAETLGTTLQMHELTGPCRVPAVAVHGGTETPVIATAPDLPDAVTSALEIAVGRIQGAPVTGDIPPDLGDERWQDQLPRLARSLRDTGWRALARPLDVGAVLSVPAPLVVEVMLVPGEEIGDE
jgi:bacteriocin biosynthesis cyclodehydratase domain-containing protein